MTPKQREIIIQAVKTDPDFKKSFVAFCRRSCKFFINTCLWIQEPRADNTFTVMPFLLREFQEDFVDELQWHIENNRSLLIDKTRAMGATWLVMGVKVWCWIFKRDFNSICGSITEDKIDSKNNTQTLFYKFDSMVESLKTDVPFLYPKGYKPKEHATHLKRMNPARNNSVVGEPMGPNFGRSGRAKWVFLDEFAEAPFPASTWAAVSHTTDCKILVFTPKGMNFAGQLANPPKGQPRTIDKITLHWMIDETKNFYYVELPDGERIAEGHGPVDPEIYRLHPGALDPVYPWYEEAKAILNWNTVLIAQELDVDYAESLEGQMYPGIERSRIMKVEFDPALPLYCAMDFGVSDSMAIVWFQYHELEHRFKFISCYQNNGKAIHWYMPFFTGTGLEEGMAYGDYSEYDLQVIRRHAEFMGRYDEFYGDPAGKARNPVTATSVITALADKNIFVRTNDKARSYEPRYQSTTEALPFCDFDEEFCLDLVAAIRDSRLRINGKVLNPVHGPESHYRSAIEYAFVNQPFGIEGIRAFHAEQARKTLEERLLQPGAIEALRTPLERLKAREEISKTHQLLLRTGETFQTFNQKNGDVHQKPKYYGHVVTAEGIAPMPMPANMVYRGQGVVDAIGFVNDTKKGGRIRTDNPYAVVQTFREAQAEQDRRLEELHARGIYGDTESILGRGPWRE